MLTYTNTPATASNSDQGFDRVLMSVQDYKNKGNKIQIRGHKSNDQYALVHVDSNGKILGVHTSFDVRYYTRQRTYVMENMTILEILDGHRIEYAKGTGLSSSHRSRIRRLLNILNSNGYDIYENRSQKIYKMK